MCARADCLVRHGESSLSLHAIALTLIRHWHALVAVAPSAFPPLDQQLCLGYFDFGSYSVLPKGLDKSSPPCQCQRHPGGQLGMILVMHRQPPRQRESPLHISFSHHHTTKQLAGTRYTEQKTE